MKKEKHVIAGLGEIGLPILRLISKASIAVGYDLNKNLMNKIKFKQYKNLETLFLHICIPFTKKIFYKHYFFKQKISTKMYCNS